MNKILTEKQYQRYIIDYLKKHNGYIERKDENFDRAYALDRELLFKFLNDTQPEEMAKLRKIYKNKFEETLIEVINNQITAKKSSLLETLKRGVDLSNIHLSLMYTKPATEYNKELNKKYAQNIFSVAEEIWATDSERVDLVVFLNGFAVMSFELKCNAAGQNYEDAISQYRTERDPQARLFLFKAGCVVNFAMDLEECYMATHLSWASTSFLPFNKGNGEGVDAGKGNPLPTNGFAVAYVWEDILQKDHLMEILTKFTFVERKIDEQTRKLKENIIFPRYHQLDCIRKLLDDVTEHKTSRNYLIQHSAGSGKTYTIAWLAHRLTSLHDLENKQIYDTIVIVTDRVVVDRQLQEAVNAIEHKAGLIRVMDQNCTSSDLQSALEGHTKIIVTTIQKFLYIADLVKGLKNKTFAVIIDEAHSSTSGKDMVAVTATLASDDDEDGNDSETIIANTLKKQGKQKNVSMFAFTATPKPTTLALFGTQTGKGQEAFHLYSMKQAIEEGFIIDVLQSFTPYETLFKINKKIAADPKFKTAKAKKKIARFAMLHPTNIAQRIEIIVEHFRNIVLSEQPWAKAMVVTSSRLEAVRYYEEFQKYVRDKGYTDVHPLIAFSGKVTDKQRGISTDDEDKYVTESSINGFSDEITAKKFDEGDYQVLLVANKYQTGFDQKKLCAMYVLKKLKGIAAVQTLSRLNRIFPPHNKKVFILDFANTIKDIEEAFKPYYTSTLLCNTVTPESIYELDEKIDSYNIFTLDDAIEANEIFYAEKTKDKQKEIKIINLLSKAKRAFASKSDKDKRELFVALRRFVRFYEFLLQVSTEVSDVELYKKYNFITWLLPYLKTGKSGDGFDLKGMIQASNFEQKEGQKVSISITSDPKLSLPTAETFNLTEDEERRLSEIIKEVNAKTGKSFDTDVAFKAALQVRDILKKDSDLISSAQSNTLDNFSMPFYDHIDDALMKGFEQNKDFFTMLLNNEEIKKEVLGVFMKSIYNDLKDKSQQ